MAKYLVTGKNKPKAYVSGKKDLEEAKRFFKETYPRTKMIVRKVKKYFK